MRRKNGQSVTPPLSEIGLKVERADMIYSMPLG
jgi:hypothetical protein